MTNFGDYVNKLDVAITEFLCAWETSPARTRGEYFLYITLTRSIMVSIDRALEKYITDSSVPAQAISHLEATAFLMCEIADQLLTQLDEVSEIH